MGPLDGPGLAKARGARLVQRKAFALVRGADSGARSLFDVADVVSEGATRHEPHGLVYYGTTALCHRGHARAGVKKKYGDPHGR